MRSVDTHVGNDRAEIIDGEHDATDAERVHRGVHRPKPDRVRSVKLVQLNALPIGSAHSLAAQCRIGALVLRQTKDCAGLHAPLSCVRGR